MIDIIKRKILKQTILSYYTGEINNYIFDDLISIESEDILIELLCKKVLFNIFDDIKLHLWFEFYSEDLRKLVSLWLYLLESKFDFSLYNQKHILNTLLTSHDSFSYREMNYSINQFFPPVTCNLLIKQERISSRIFLPQSYILMKYIKKFIAIIESRNEKELQQSIKKKFIFYDSKNLEFFSWDKIRKMQPTDDMLFCISDKKKIFKYFELQDNKFLWSDYGTWNEII